MIDDLPPLRSVIEKHGLSAKKNLGQNFLLDLNITSKIAKFAGDLEGENVIEIGPGPGGLTRAILACNPNKLTVFERDERVAPIMEGISNAYRDKLDVCFGDALKSDIFADQSQPVHIISNLPYNIGTELLTRWLSMDWFPPWKSLTLMFQDEVAQRITATSEDKQWGRLAVLANWRSTSKIVYRLPPSAFIPAPKVHSAVVHITPTKPKLDVELSQLTSITKAAFGQRRKMLRASLKSQAKNAESILENAGIDPKRRAETLTLEEFGIVTKAFYQ